MAQDDNLDTIYNDFQQPDFKSGKYELQVELGGSGVMRLRNQLSKDTNKQVFYVAGQRFNLPANLFNSAYPPEQAVGNFARCMPHLVFSKSTLPWEWNIVLPGAHSSLPTPCMVLLVFNETEIPKIQTVRIDSFKNISPITGEDFTKECLSIEIETTLFNRLMPRADELPFLFHTKSKGADKYAVAIANRMPLPGKNEVHLVSLMGIDDDRLNNKTRLISLKKWSFHSVDERKGNFTDLVSNCRHGAIRYKADYGSKQLSDKAKSLLSQRGDQAFSLLPHHLTDGSSHASWYRGPLIPFEKKRKENYFIHQNAFLDREAKGNDLSYRAAWQLGQLLALQNQIFVQKLQSWKQTILGKPSGANASLKIDQVLSVLDQSHLLNFKQEQNADKSKPASEEEASDAAVKKWMTELSLLHHLPYYYLIPSDQLIAADKQGEIAYFYIDPEWIDHLMSGAMSFVFLGSTQISNDLLVAVQKLMAEIPQQTISGFVLQSSVVKDWPKMEIAAKLGEADVHLIRRENLNDHILMALYDGSIDQVSFAEPFQALHFGFENDGTRKISQTKIKQTWRWEESKVLDINKLVQQIAEALQQPIGQLMPSAFAFNMVDSADRVIFKK